MRRWISVPLLLLLVLLWLFPERFGLSGRWPTRTLDGAKIVVRDGDTMTIAKQDYRLYGIDAPEFTQRCTTAAGSDWQCGEAARTALAGLLRGRTLGCQERARDKFERVVATCTDDSGRDIGQAMIDLGLAVSFGGFGQSPYAAQEARAKAARRGIWQGPFMLPSSWRSANPRTLVANR